MTLKEILSGKVKTAVKIENQEQFIEIDKISIKNTGVYLVTAFMFLGEKYPFYYVYTESKYQLPLQDEEGIKFHGYTIITFEELKERLKCQKTLE